MYPKQFKVGTQIDTNIHSVTIIGVLGFPKIKIKRKPQRKFQTDFIKLMLKPNGGSTEKRKVL